MLATCLQHAITLGNATQTSVNAWSLGSMNNAKKSYEIQAAFTLFHLTAYCYQSYDLGKHIVEHVKPKTPEGLVNTRILYLCINVSTFVFIFVSVVFFQVEAASPVEEFKIRYTRYDVNLGKTCSYRVQPIFLNYALLAKPCAIVF